MNKNLRIFSHVGYAVALMCMILLSGELRAAEVQTNLMDSMTIVKTYEMSDYGSGQKLSGSPESSTYYDEACGEAEADHDFGSWQDNQGGYGCEWDVASVHNSIYYSGSWAYTASKRNMWYSNVVDLTSNGIGSAVCSNVRFKWTFQDDTRIGAGSIWITNNPNYTTYTCNLRVGITNNTLPVISIKHPDYWPFNTDPNWLSNGCERLYVPLVPQVMAMIETSQSENTADPKANTTDIVNVCDGNMTISATDLAIPCPGIPLIFRRTYNSITNCNRALDGNWTHTFEWRLFTTNTLFNGQTNNWMVAARGDGNSYWFLSTNGAYLSPEENDWTLTSTSSNYTLRIPAGGVFLQFGTNGYLNAISDQWCNVVSLTYSNGVSPMLTKIQHNNGQYMNLAYDNAGHVVQISTPSTNLTMHYAYNPFGELTNATRITSSGTTVESFLYTADGMHSLTQRINAVGDHYPCAYETDGSGLSTGRAISNNVAGQYYVTGVSYSDDVNEAFVTYSKRGTNVTYEYDIDPILNRVMSIKWPYFEPDSSNWYNQSVMWMSDMDQYGFALTNTLNDSSVGEQTVWACQRDASHNITSEGFGYCAEPSNFWDYTWDTNSENLTSITDPENHMMEFEYTNASLSKIKLYYDASDSYDTLLSYTTNGLLSVVTNANGHWIQFGHDNYGFLTSAVPQVGPTVLYSNSVLGYVQKITLPGEVLGTNNPPDPPQTITRDILIDSDELGRVKKITYPNLLYETFAWDAVGNMTNHIDTAGRTTQYSYLPTHELSNVVRRLSSGIALTNSVSYDAMFNTINLKDAKNRPVESYALDIQDRVTNVVNLESQSMNVSYGVSDFVKSTARFDGSMVNIGYNGDGLLSQLAFPDSTNSYSYLKNGLLALATNELGTISNSWSFANRLASSTFQVSSFTSQVSYTFWPAGNVSNVTSVAGTNTYSFDEAERLTNLTASLKSSALNFAFSYNDNNSLVSAVTCTNTGISVNYTYDIMDRLDGITWGTTNGTLRSFAYAFNNANMITGITREDGENYQYKYDDLDRLTNATCYAAGGTVSSDEKFVYDEVGNRISKVTSGITLTYSYSNGCNRLSNWAITQTNLGATVYVSGCANEPVGTNSMFGQLWISNKTAVTPFVDGTNFWVYDLPMNLGTQQIVAAIRDMAGNTTYKTNTVTLSIVTNGTYQYNSAGCVTNIGYTGAGFART